MKRKCLPQSMPSQYELKNGGQNLVTIYQEIAEGQTSIPRQAVPLYDHVNLKGSHKVSMKTMSTQLIK